MMKEGIYTVVFESNIHALGEGIIVVDDKKIHGGDIAFTCRGYLNSPNMEMEIIHYNEDIPSTLGVDGNYTLVLQYNLVTDGQYHLSGYVKDDPDKHLKALALFITPLLD